MQLKKTNKLLNSKIVLSFDHAFKRAISFSICISIYLLLFLNLSLSF